MKSICRISSLESIEFTPIGIQTNGLELRRFSFANVLSVDIFNQIKSKNEEKSYAYLISSQGLCTGYQEWSIKILKCDVYKQEIGVISNLIENVDQYNSSFKGISGTQEFQARAVYGNELMTDSVYYASYNDNGKVRCYKNLVKDKKKRNRTIGWCQGDVIKVSLDLDRWKCTFYLNGNKVRKSISVQPERMYYPIISYAGNCKYELLHFDGDLE